MKGSKFVRGKVTLMEWKEKVVVVTGASKSMGKGIALHFAELGAKVVVGFRSSLADAENCVNDIKDATGNENVTFKKIDVVDRSAVQDAFKEILEEEGRIDVLVNNAGLSNAGALISTTPLEKWDEIIETNIMGTINCIQAVSLHMLLEKRGSIINISSLAGLVGIEGLSVYSASKAGVIGLIKSLGKEYAPYNVRVNAIAPGFIEDTGMVKRIPEKQMSDFKEKIAMKRLGTSKEIAEAVSYLASDKASYITGQTLVVDGGLM